MHGLILNHQGVPYPKHEQRKSTFSVFTLQEK